MTTILGICFIINVVLTKTEKAHQPPGVIGRDAILPYQMRYRWVMVFLAWLLYSVFGLVLRSISPLITPIITDLNIPYAQMGLILGAWPLTYILVALVAGNLIDRWGIRRSLLLGTIIIGLSEVLRYFTNGFWALFFMVALFGVGGPLISIGCPKTIAEWFRGKDRGTAIGIYTTGPWIGGIMAYSMTNSVVMPLTGNNWRLAFVVYGAIVFIAALVWWFMARDVKTATGTGETASLAKVFTGLIKLRNIQLLLIMGFLVFTVSHGFNDWLPKLLEIGGLPPAIAGFAASIPLVVGIPGVLIIPRFTPLHLRGRMVALMSLGIAGALLITAVASGASLVAGLVIYGIAECSVLPLLMLVLMELPEVGSKYMGSAGGMFFCAAEVGGFAGPLLMGAIKDLTGSFLGGASALSATAVAMAIMALFLKTSGTEETKA
ncbi:MAG: MFS transporter [Chloroflexota bacterium]